MVRRRTYTKEFKESSLDFYHSSGKTLKDVSCELGINPENLRRWINESKEAGSGNIRLFPGSGNARDEELARLRKENADLREANEILKKATAIFAAKRPY